MAGEQLPLEEERSAGVQLTERLNYWNDFFDQAEDEDYIQQAETAINELDALWERQKLLGVTCIVNGTGIWSEHIGREAEELDEATVIEGFSPDLQHAIRSGEVVGALGISHGFVIRSLAEGERPQLCCQFEIGQVRALLHPTLQHDMTQFMFVEARDFTVVPIASFEEPFVDNIKGIPGEEQAVDSVTPIRVVDYYSERFVQLVKSTRFRRQSRQSQMKAVEYLVDQANATSGIRESQVLLEADYAYVPVLNEQGRITQKIVGLHGLVVSGVCLGITATEQDRLTHKAVRRDSDLMNKYAGLSMTIELTEDAKLPEYLQLPPGSIVHVPIAGQAIDILIEPAMHVQQMLRERSKRSEDSVEQPEQESF